MLIEPPKEFCRFDTVVDQPMMLNEAVGLLPKSNLGRLAEKPAIANDSMLTWLQASQQGGLRGASHGRVGSDPRNRVAELPEIWRMLQKFWS